jgi:hypothetical protein
MKGDITKIYGVDLVGSQDPNALVRTDDAVGLNVTVGASEITSDFDNCYPWSDIEEVTDQFGNVFIKIPKFYSKITEFSGRKYWHQLSGTKHEGFDTLFKIGERELDYVMVGKYEGSGSKEMIYSKSGQKPLVQITMDNYRSGCAANGPGYQQYDFLIDLIIKELWLVEMKTTNCQSIMYGYANNNSNKITTGTTDSVATPSGSPVSNTDGKHACKYRGIENPWGDIETWCDGISFNGLSVYVCTEPTAYSAGKTTEPYKYYGKRSEGHSYVKSFGPLTTGSLIQYNKWISEYVDSDTSDSTYFSDYVSTHNTEPEGKGTILCCGGYMNYETMAGLWCYDGSQVASFSHGSIGGRLCYKPPIPVALSDFFNVNRNRINCVIKTTNSVQQERLGLSVFPLAATVNQEAFYLQPDSWVDDKTGDLIKKENTQREYLNYPHPFDLDTGEELTGYTHINDSINTKASREIGVCCLQSQPVASPGQYNVWTDLKRTQIETPAGFRVVQTQEPATWDDTKFWVEGWDKDTDTHMAQVKRHPQLTNKTLKIDCYMKNIDDLYTGLETCTLSYEDDTKNNSGTWYLKRGDSTYITLKVTQTQKQEGQS